MRSLKAFWKLVRATGHATRGWWTIHTRFHRFTQPERNALVQQWAERMLAILDIRLEVRGAPPAAGPVLVVANHVSWLDIVTLHAARHVRFVSKASVRHWPLIGTLSDGAGSLYIERERRRDALRVAHSMAEALRGGDLIAVFPEGTTGDGVTLRSFHANLLQAAISADAPVLPVALRFADAASGQTSFAPRYIEKDTFIRSLWRTLRAPPLVAFVHYGQAQKQDGRDRRSWADGLHREVQALRRATLPGEESV